jgi:hypothetical protein
VRVNDIHRSYRDKALNINNLIPPRRESPSARAYKLGLAAVTHVFGLEWRDKNIVLARRGFLRNVTALSRSSVLLVNSPVHSKPGCLNLNSLGRSSPS